MRAPSDTSPLDAGESTWPRVATAALLGAALAVCLAYVAVELYLHGGRLGLPLDDSWIHLQFARNLAAGQGLSLNAGELVSGSTAPLWTGLVSLLFLLPVGPVATVKALGVALHLATVHAVTVLGRELELGRWGTTLAAALTLGTGWLVWGALSGLEIPLFACLSLWGVILHLRERRRGGVPWSIAVLALAVLARPEGALLLLLALADRLLVVRRTGDGLVVRTPRPAWLGRALLLLAILVGPVMLFNLVVADSVLPTTFFAKASGDRRWLPDIGYLHSILSIFFRPHPVPVLFAAAGAATLVERLGGDRDRGLLPALWLLGLPLAYSAISPVGGPTLAGSFGRYYFPLFPFLAVVGTLGLERVGAALGPRLWLGGLRLPLRAVLLTLVLWPTATSMVEGAGRYVQSIGNVDDGDVAVAHWLAERLPAQAVLAVNDIGAIKYFLPENRVLDLAGIGNPELVDYERQARAQGKRVVDAELRFLEENRPDFLVIFPRWFPGLMAEGSSFRPLLVVDVPGNITLGDSRIVVLATPWTRFALAGAEENEERP